MIEAPTGATPAISGVTTKTLVYTRRLSDDTAVQFRFTNNNCYVRTRTAAGVVASGIHGR